MKLFITNRKEFEDRFPNSREIHKEAFHTLEGSLAKGFIPLSLFPHYKDEGEAILDFVNKNQEIYYYEFTTTIS